jgi:glycosidase
MKAPHHSPGSAPGNVPRLSLEGLALVASGAAPPAAGRALRNEQVTKAWTGGTYTYTVRLSSDATADLRRLRVRLTLQGMEFAGYLRGKNLLDKDFELAWEIPMEYAGKVGGYLVFAAQAGFAAPGFLRLNAAAAYRGKDGWSRDVTLYPEGQGVQVLVHPAWASGARLFEAYVRYFGASRDIDGNVRVGTLRDLAEQVPWLAQLGFDGIWAMGVFRRGRRAVKGIGSPYAIHDHRQVDPEMGDDRDLLALRDAARSWGMKLGLDFVGNHTSWDSPLLCAHPDWYEGTVAPEELTKDKHRWIRAGGGGWLIRQGHSRYDEWDDVAQLDWNHEGLRDYMKETLLHLVETYDVDFIRCDMAMLMQRKVRYWENAAEVWEERWPGMDGEWWHEVILAAMKIKPDIVFIAEVYWGNDCRLQELGFALTYDHGFYHHLIDKKWGKDIRDYLRGQADWLPPGAATLHYIENHDELRIHASTDSRRVVSALLNLFTERGAVMVYNGQMEGEWNRPSIDAPWHDAPSPGIDALNWKVHEHMLYLGRRYPMLRSGGTIDLLDEQDTPYRVLARFSSPADFVVVAVNQSTEVGEVLPLAIPLPAARLGILDSPEIGYRLTAHYVRTVSAGDDSVDFACVEQVRSGADLARVGLEVALPGNSGCLWHIERDGTAGAPEDDAETLEQDLEGLVDLGDHRAAFREFLVFKHDKLRWLARALDSNSPELAALAVRLLASYSEALRAFPKLCEPQVTAGRGGRLVLRLPDPRARYVLSVPDWIAVESLECNDCESFVGTSRCGLTPVYTQATGPAPCAELSLRVGAVDTENHRGHLMFRRRELERLHKLNIAVSEPACETATFIHRQPLNIAVSLHDPLADDHRFSLSALTDVAAEPSAPVPLQWDAQTGRYFAELRAEVLGWHPLRVLLLDDWMGFARRLDRETHLNVVPEWAIGLNGYTVWLRHVRRPGKDPQAHADFADLQWVITHAHDLGFNVVLLLPITDPVGHSPYEQLCARALDPDYLILDDFLPRAASHLSPNAKDDPDYQAFASQRWVTEYAEIKARRLLRSERPAFDPGGPLHEVWLAALAAAGADPSADISLGTLRRREPQFLRSTPAYQVLRRLVTVQQYVARQQLEQVLDAAHALGVKVLFDQPLYPSSHSAERMCHPERFRPERWMRSPDGTQRWPFARYDWTYERTRSYEHYVEPIAYFIEDLGFDGFRWDAIHTIYLDGQEDLLRRVARRFNGRAIVKLGEQLGVDEQAVNPVLERYGYMLYLVPWWYPGHQVSDTVAKLEERLMVADRGNWWLASSLHDHPRIADWFEPLVQRYGAPPRRYPARFVQLMLRVFAFFPNFILFCGDEYASKRRLNVPGDAGNTWTALPPWAEAVDDLTEAVRHLNRLRSEHPDLRRPGGRQVLANDRKAEGVLSLALLGVSGSFLLAANFSPRYAGAWITAPLEAMGVDPGVDFTLPDLFSGETLEFVSGESVMPEDSTLWLHLRFGEARLLYIPKGGEEIAPRAP